MMMTCDEVRMSLGVYALGALEPDERVLVEAHLAECAECRAELEELAGVATFLGRVSEGDVAQVASPPRAVLDRLLSAKVRRRRTNRLMLSLAASVLVVGLGGGTLWVVTQSPPEATTASAPQPAQAAQSAQADRAPADAGGRQESAQSFTDSTAPDASAKAKSSRSPVASPAPEVLLAPSELRFEKSDSTGTVRAVVTASAGEGTTTVKVVLTGVAKGTRCRLEVIGEGGLRETAGNWVVNRAAYDRSGSFTATTTIPPERITAFKITTAGGRVLLTIPTR
ncbi:MULTISPECIES: anti-sigma factor family protein [unclassified Streptosporangium]|uniref:anti-sigma factor family protein n=1 Tax=unclassified Streptosporangium TaxID=2632669 RepID=UPI002E2D717B|nr:MULTISPECIES: zf-HC2 domain-containing protein [unclassified Streptosporangium]